MKKFFALLLFQTVSVGYISASIPFNQLGHRFNPTNVIFVWSVPTNDLPRGLWVYRTSPSEFSPTVISNLMVLGSFTANDRKKDAPLGVSAFTSPNGKKILWIYPERGYFDYDDDAADDMHIAEGVPDEKRAFELATNYLPKLGIDYAQLAKKTNGDLRTYFIEATAILYKGRGMPAYATNTHMRGIYFIRSLDGVDFTGTGGRGGCQIEFGHHETASRIILSWRKLERDKFYPVATTGMFLKWIREGKAVYEPSPDHNLDWSAVKKMTIIKATPYYFGEVYIEPQKWIYPFTRLETSVATAQTNFTAYLYCPLIDETKPLKASQ